MLSHEPPEDVDVARRIPEQAGSAALVAGIARLAIPGGRVFPYPVYSPEASPDVSSLRKTSAPRILE